MPWARAAAVLLFLIAALGTSAAAPPSRAALPRFLATSCPFALGKGMVDGKSVRCGYLLVPEDRRHPSGMVLRLAVAIFKTPSVTPSPDPVVFLQGGPGGALLQGFGPSITSDFTPLIARTRDFILLDQRGTGYSRPPLTCPEFTALKYQTLNMNLPIATQIAMNVAAAQHCRARLSSSGINLAAYSTAADAADVEDLRRALGYRTVNLYGVSYGTRLALAVMQAYPAGVRSVVLDSVVPAQLDTFVSPARTIKGALDVLFADCAVSAACNSAYPHLSAAFYGAAARLNAHPISLSVTANTDGKPRQFLLNGTALIDITFNSFYQSQLIPSLPEMISDAARGQYRLLKQIAGTVEFQFDTDISFGLYYSVECSEQAPFTTLAKVTTAASGLQPSLRAYIVAGAQSDLHVCASWHVGKAPAEVRAPVISSIPTLVLSGRYDPVTPPWTGLLAAQTLRKSYTYIFPSEGHGIFLSGPCSYQITNDFLADPSTRPAQGVCVTSLRNPTFALPSSAP